VTGRRERRRRELLDDLKETSGYCKFKNDALDGTLENSQWKRLLTYRKTDYGMTAERSINGLL
jgi:hypothetical protein